MFGWFKHIRQGAKLKEVYQRYERALVSLFLIGGFLLDFFTFRTLDIHITLTILAIHLSLAALTILYVFHYDDQGLLQHPFWNRLRFFAPLITQLAFGSLLSMSFLFYWFSGALSVSWPIFILLISLIVLNESFRHAYLRPVAQVTLFAFVLLSYATLTFPFLFNSLDPWIVIFAGGLSLVLSLLFALLLIRVAPGLKKMRERIIVSVCATFVAMSGLYLFDFIPPIPLSLREAGVYYRVQRVGNEYELVGEPRTIWNTIFGTQTLYQEAGERVYVFTSVYSPADLDTIIFHQWEFYDPSAQAWIKKDRLSFPITGGNAIGYRGYTFKTRLAPGKWRVRVETELGQVLGRVQFTYNISK
ncbi:DUF2914 domain-containing protein [Candidatus Uhrbacteria bacterium]|nr:DUF2914 domain-containing protein [Candidatus Uhrbacteria bacterium]